MSDEETQIENSRTELMPDPISIEERERDQLRLQVKIVLAFCPLDRMRRLPFCTCLN